jgi:hypothetical protein
MKAFILATACIASAQASFDCAFTTYAIKDFITGEALGFQADQTNQNTDCYLQSKKTGELIQNLFESTLAITP